MPKASCAFTHCKNNWYKLKQWRETVCPIHEENYNGGKCNCPPPFTHLKFPTDNAPKNEWERIVYRAKPGTKQENKLKWTANDNSRICSTHFIDGHPTEQHPYPTENLPKENYFQRPAPKARQPCKRDSTSHPPLSSKKSKTSSPAPPVCTTPSSPPDSKQDFSHVTSFHTYALNLPTETIGCECDDLNDPIIDPLEYCAPCQRKDIKIKSLQSLVTKLKNEIRHLQRKIDVKCKKPFDMTNLKDDKTVIFYTGVPTLNAFNALFSYLEPMARRIKLWKGAKTVSHIIRKFKCTPKKFGPSRSLSAKEEFVLVLMKIKLGLLNMDLAQRFGLASSSVTRILNSWFPFLAKELVIINTDLPTVIENAPKSFRNSIYSDTRHIIDCSEIFIATPKDYLNKVKTWSDYKHHHTIKFLVSVSPDGTITYISECWGGRSSDNAIVKKSGFLDILEPQDKIMADKGFSSLGKEFAECRAYLIVPPGKRGADQLPKQGVQKTKDVANRRIHVEQVIRRMKVFHVIKNEMPISLVPNADYIIRICAFLSNLRGPITKAPRN